MKERKRNIISLKRRIISLFLAVMMIIGVMPMNAFAVGENETDNLGQVHVIIENTNFTEDKWPSPGDDDYDEDVNYWDGELLDTMVSLTPDMTMMSAIKEALDTANISYEGADGTYISSINGLAEFDGGSGSGWTGTLNDYYVNRGFADWKVSEGELMDGDEIRVMYTCDLGADVGAGEETKDNTTLIGLTVSDGTMTPSFASDVENYTIALSKDVESIKVGATAANKGNQVYLSVGETEFRRTASIPVEDGTVIQVTCGETNADEGVLATTYTLTVDMSEDDNTDNPDSPADGTTEPPEEEIPELPEGDTYEATFTGHSAQVNTFKVYVYDDGAVGNVDLLEGVEDSDTSYSTVYVKELPAGDYLVEGYDEYGDCSGSIVVTVTADGENEFVINRAYDLKATNSGFVLGEDYTIRAEVTEADMTQRIVTMGTAQDYNGNYYPSVLALYGDTVKVFYTPTEKRVAENYIETFKSATLTASSSSLSISIPQAVAVTFVAPAGSVVSAGRFHTYYIYDFAQPKTVTNNTDGTVSYTFMIPKSTEWFYRVQNEEGVTYWNYAKWTADTTVNITEAELYIGSEEFDSDTIYRYDYNQYDRADIYMNINGQEYMDMNVGEEFQLNMFRNWMAIESINNAKVALPDMEYKVIDINGNASDVLTIVPDANNSSVATMKANKEGTAVVLVTYDAMTHMLGQTTGKDDATKRRFSAIWPECTGVFVVTVGAGEADIETGMIMERYEGTDTGMDAEHDILFYLGEEGAEFTFAPESGVSVSVARATLTEKSLTYTGFTTDGVIMNEDGTVTVNGLTSGRHIIKIEKEGKTTYQVVTARGVSLEIQKKVTITSEDGTETTSYVAMTEEEIAGIAAGDTIYLQFTNLVNPAEKMSGNYNFNARILYYGDDGSTYMTPSLGNYGSYDFSGNPVRQHMEVTIPKYWTGDSYTLNGAIKMAGFSNVSIGGHRGTTYAKGVNAGFDAPAVGMTLSSMPSVTFNLKQTEFLTNSLTFQNENGTAIELSDITSVILTDESGNEQQMNPEDGTFMCVAENYNYVVYASGYLYKAGTLTVSENQETHVITLTKAAENAWDGVTTTEPAKDENSVYLIGTGAELAWFGATVNSGGDGTNTISGKLTADIDLANYFWTPMGTNNNKKIFKGSLDGDGHVITNLNVNATADYAGLFGDVSSGAEIKNLKVSGKVNSTNQYVGGIAGYVYGSSTEPITIENCIADVDVTVDVAKKKNYVAGIAGYVGGVVSITNCANLGDIVTGGNYAAGIAAYISGNVSITASYNKGDITANGYAGGILGYNGTNQITVKACYNEGNITAANTNNGGIAGWLKGSSSNKSVVADVYNAGTVTGGEYTESLFGILENVELERAYSLSGTTDSYGEQLASYKLKTAYLDSDYYCGTCDGYPALCWQTDARFHEKKDGVVTEPDCTNLGYTTYLCDECNVQFKSDYVDPLGHDWCECTEENENCADCIYTAPDCVTEGKVEHDCRRDGCDEIKTDIIPANGHTADEEQTIDHIYYADCVCAVCGESYVVWDDERLNHMTLPTAGLSGITMTDNDYPWVWNEEAGRFESSNKGINSSTSQTNLEITLTETATVSFNYGVSSESGWDKMTISAVIGEETVKIADAISGTTESTFTQELTAGTYTITFAYSKDSSSASGSDMGWFSNLVIAVDQTVVDKAAAEAVIKKIEAIGEVSLDSESEIEEAREAYEGLTDTQKALVINLEVLEAAEARLKELKAEEPDVQVIAFGWSGDTKWTLTEDGILKFTGIGVMKRYSSSTAMPWNEYKKSVKEVIIEEGITRIGDFAFYGMNNLESVQLPAEGLTEIGKYAFKGCEKLEEIQLNTGLKTIGEAAFYGCSALKAIYIPDGVYTIWEYTFKNCTSLNNVRLPKTLIKIGQGAFESCTGLNYIFIPGETDIIGAWSFKGCTGLKEADMIYANALEIREGAFKNCKKITDNCNA